MKPANVVTEMTKAESDSQKIRQLETALKRVREDLDEYILAEKVMVAAGKISEDTVRQAHDIVRPLV